MTTSDVAASDEIRRQASAPVVQQNKRATASKTFQPPIFKYLQTIQNHQNIYFTYTTRGLGFATQRIFDIAQDCKPHQITVQCVYRIALFQLENQLTLASDNSHDTPSDILPDRRLLPNNYRSAVVRNIRTNLSVLAEFVNLSGTFQQFNRYYTPYIPCAVIKTANVLCQPAEEAGPALRRARPARVAECQRNVQITEHPDPYTVSFSNLREVVQYLANPDTNEEVRSYFHDRNPLPGAIWNEDLLTNPQDFAPENYGPNDLLDDYDNLLQWMRKLKGKYSDLFAECNFSGVGHNCQLVYSKIEGCLNEKLHVNDIHHVSLEGGSESFMYAGIGLLSGETPDSHDCCTIMVKQQEFALRAHTLGGHKLPATYREIMRSIVPVKDY